MDDDGTSVEDGAMAANQGGRLGKAKPTDGPEGGLGSVIGGRSTGADGVVAGHVTTGDWGGEGREPSGRGVRMHAHGKDPAIGERGAGAGDEARLHAFTDDEEPSAGGRTRARSRSRTD